MSKINEGLRKDDLMNMVSGRVSVDEYESKIDDSAIVVAFYVLGKDAAMDVNRFLQKSYVDLLDTEVSAAPDQKGYYIVFVELAMNTKTADSIAGLCRELTSVCGNEKWDFSIRGEEDSKVIALDQISSEIAPKLQALVESWFPADLTHKVTIHEGHVQVSGPISSLAFEIADYGSFMPVFTRNRLNEAPVDLTQYRSECYYSAKNLLGESWQLDCVKNYIVAYHPRTDKLLLIKSMPY
jgi:hypothetical protein